MHRRHRHDRRPSSPCEARPRRSRTGRRAVDRPRTMARAVGAAARGRAAARAAAGRGAGRSGTARSRSLGDEREQVRRRSARGMPIARADQLSRARAGSGRRPRRPWSPTPRSTRSRPRVRVGREVGRRRSATAGWRPARRRSARCRRAAAGTRANAAATMTSTMPPSADDHAGRRARPAARAARRARRAGSPQGRGTEGDRGRGEPGERFLARDLGGEERAERQRRAEGDAAEHLPGRQHPAPCAAGRGESRSTLPRGAGRCQASRAVLRRMPSPVISTSTVSPATNGPTPAGVPVRITSPGSSVNAADA